MLTVNYKNRLRVTDDPVTSNRSETRPNVEGWACGSEGWEGLGPVAAGNVFLLAAFCIVSA